MIKRNRFSAAALVFGGLILFGQQASAFNSTVCEWNISGNQGRQAYESTTTLLTTGTFASVGNVHLSFEMDEEGSQNSQQYLIHALILDQHAIQTGIGPKNIRLRSEHKAPPTRIDSDLYEEERSQNDDMSSIVTLNKSVRLSDGKSLSIAAKCETSYGD